MKLIDLKITDFMSKLGSASALAASMGAALVMMVAELTIGKKKYAEYDDEMKEILKDARKVHEALLLAIDNDTEAFNQVSAVFSMPKEIEEEKVKRREATQVALKGAAVCPYEIMGEISEGLKITARAIGKSNVNAASDLGVAALNMKSGIQGAWLNVLINLSGIKDEVFITKYRQKGEKLLKTVVY